MALIWFCQHKDEHTFSLWGIIIMITFNKFKYHRELAVIKIIVFQTPVLTNLTMASLKALHSAAGFISD